MITRKRGGNFTWHVAAIIVIDPNLLRFDAGNNTCATEDLLLALRRGVTITRLKIMVLAFGINE